MTRSAPSEGGAKDLATIEAMDDVISAATKAIATHPAVNSVEFAGSRSRGTHDELSDWDQVLLRGPVKIEYLFLDRSQDPTPPRTPSPETLPAINTHFWDWMWWLTTKASIGRTDLVQEHLAQLYAQLLRPMGISEAPVSIDAAVESFVARRDALEERFGITVDRALENEVREGMRRVLGM